MDEDAVITAAGEDKNLVQIGSEPQPEPEWTKGPMLSELRERRPFRWDLDDTKKNSVLLLLLEGELHAYRNRCAHMGLPMEKGIIDPQTNALMCPYHCYKFDATTGQCFNFIHMKLTVFPVELREDYVWFKPS